MRSISTEHKNALAAQQTALRRKLAILWLVLLGVSAIIVLADDIPVAGPNGEFAGAVATLAGAVGSALLYLSTLRFFVFGRPLDLCVGLAFGILALADLLVSVVAPAARIQPARLEVGLYLLLLFQAVAALLFFVPLLRSEAVVPPTSRRRYAVWLIGSIVLGIALGTTAIVGGGNQLPPAL